MKKKMISCLMDKAYEMGYELTKEDVWTFERECLNICAIRAGGMDKVDEYLEAKGLKKAYDDYENDADNLYYKEFVEIRMELNPLYGIANTAYERACKIEGRILTDDEYSIFCDLYSDPLTERFVNDYEDDKL